jgi:hypothetical protein
MCGNWISVRERKTGQHKSGGVLIQECTLLQRERENVIELGAYIALQNRLGGCSRGECKSNQNNARALEMPVTLFRHAILNKLLLFASLGGK